ncbi:MAG: hypothetical protein ACK4MD_02100 [Demequina sp.]
MRALRTLVSAVCIIAAAALIAWWAVASVIVTQIEDGAAVRGITERALDSPTVMAALSAELSDRAQAELAAQGLHLAALGLDDDLDEAISRAVATEAFRATVLDQVDDAHGQVSEQLTDSLREPAPLVVTVDLSDAVNARVADLGGFAAAAPEIAVPPVTLHLLDEAQFENTREAYERTMWAQQWGLWIGLGLLALGWIVSYRRRWFLAKLLMGIGLICLAFGGAVALIGPETITTFLPGGEQGSLSTMWREVLTAEASPLVVERALSFGGIALAAAVVATIVGALMGGRRR